MTKNGMIRVFDENGNEIGQTYPKRVHGLIKKGRARFMDESETAIVLTETEPKIEYTEACPPNNLTLSEDINMATNTATAIVLENNENNTEDIREETGAMPEELRRLYDKLDEIDGEIFKLSEPDQTMTMDEFHALLNTFDRMRGDIVEMITEFKKKPKVVNIEEEFYVKQLKILMDIMAEKDAEMANLLVHANIDTAEYEEMTAALDARFSKRMNELLDRLASADNANE